MLSLIQEYAPPGPAVGSVSFDFVHIGWHGFGQARKPSSPIGQTVQMLFWESRTGLASLASLTESVRMPSTGKPKAAQGTDED